MWFLSPQPLPGRYWPVAAPLFGEFVPWLATAIAPPVPPRSAATVTTDAIRDFMNANPPLSPADRVMTRRLI